MENLNVIIERLTSEMKLLDEAPNRKNRTQVRKTLQQLKTKCHSLRKEVLGTTKSSVVEEPVAPVAPVIEEPVAPVVEEVEEPVGPQPVSEHPIPDSQPEPIKEKKVKKEKKEKKEKKVNKRKKTE
jgi:hypothetical protein